MGRITILALAALALPGCGDGEPPDRAEEPAPAQEVERASTENDVETVRLDTVTWFTEGRTVEFQDGTWIMVGEPVYDPIVERVGEFEGTPLYARVGVAAPAALYIPVGGNYWQRLEPTTAPSVEEPGDTAEPADTAAGEG